MGHEWDFSVPPAPGTNHEDYMLAVTSVELSPLRCLCSRTNSKPPASGSPLSSFKQAARARLAGFRTHKTECLKVGIFGRHKVLAGREGPLCGVLHRISTLGRIRVHHLPGTAWPTHCLQYPKQCQICQVEKECGFRRATTRR